MDDAASVFTHGFRPLVIRNFFLMEIPLSQALRVRSPFLVFIGCALLEALSFAAWHVPQIHVAALAAFVIGAVCLAFLDLRWLYAFTLLEMIVGSHGRLFFVELFGFSISLRMAIFAVMMLGWTAYVLSGRARILHFSHAHVTAPLLLFIATIALSVAKGASSGSSLARIFSDANGYAFMFLIPVGLDLFANRRSFAGLLPMLAGAVAWLSAKSLILLYLFTHGFNASFLQDIFKWQRKFGLAEITHLAGGSVRVFAASDIFLLPALFAGFLLVWTSRKRLMMFWAALVAAAFALSMSRSFWLGALVSSIVALPAFMRLGIARREGFGSFFARIFSVSVLGGLLLAGTMLFPFPAPIRAVEAWSAYGDRILSASDAAVSSRWNMLEPLQRAISSAPVFGSGFGTRISYQSDDPRMHDLFPGGRVTTSALEWQYLEIWLKMGLFGLAAVMWLWWRIGWYFWKTLQDVQGADQLSVAVLALSFLAFIVANVFTPYLNHPLGWGFLALVIVGLHAHQVRELPNHHERPTPMTLR